MKFNMRSVSQCGLIAQEHTSFVCISKLVTVKHADDKRVLFLVDTLNLGEPASVLLGWIKKDKAHEK
jgi:hypothetical protein